MKLLLFFKIALLCAALLFSVKTWAEENYDGFTVRQYDPQHEKLALFLNDDTGKPLNSFGNLAAWLASQHQHLLFAMNAGMYQENFSPVGLLVLEGKTVKKLNLRDAKGNFYLKPNGVFLVTPQGAKIVESSRYPSLAKDVLFATQSGPLLINQGTIHPIFKPDSTSRLIRNGVGIADNKVYLVISDKPVNLYEFAIFFKQTLQCDHALYLDGVVSAIYSEALHRDDQQVLIGPMLGLVEK